MRWMLLLLCACAPEAVAPGNILIILADDVGIDKLAAYGLNPSAPSTPQIDQLAEEGMLFRRAFSASTCSPARASLLTGRHAYRTGVGRTVLANEHTFMLSPHEHSIADVVHDSPHHDWSTSVIGKWHLGSHRIHRGLHHPNALGFDWFGISMGNITGVIFDHGDAERGYERWEKNTNGVLQVTTAYATTDHIDDALERMATMPEPWLLALWPHAAHTPLHRPPDALIRTPLPERPTETQLFGALVESLDTELTRLYDGMPADMRARTTTLFIGDNGTPNHALEVYPPGTGKQTLLEGGVRVPLILHGPGIEPGEAQALAHMVDVLPTVAELAGVELSHEVDGESLLASVRDPDRPGRDAVYTEKFAPNGFGSRVRSVRGVRGQHHRYLLDVITGTERLWRLDADGLEEGANLLVGDLSPEDQVALDQLRREADRGG